MNKLLAEFLLLLFFEGIYLHFLHLLTMNYGMVIFSGWTLFGVGISMLCLGLMVIKVFHRAYRVVRK